MKIGLQGSLDKANYLRTHFMQRKTKHFGTEKSKEDQDVKMNEEDKNGEEDDLLDYQKRY